MSDLKKDVFKIGETEYAVLTPSAKDWREATKAYNAAFGESANSDNPMFREKLDEILIKQGVWSSEKEKNRIELLQSLADNELKLKKGGIKLQEARDIALQMRLTRLDLLELLSVRAKYDACTVEGQAENTRFNTLVSHCLVYNTTGERVYKSLEEYMEKGEEEQAYTGAQKLASMIQGIDKDYDRALPENKFLSKWNFVDENLRLVNKQGHLIDLDGRLINEDGNYVDEDGNVVDINGVKIADDGEYDVEFSPFLDDEGNPIEQEVESEDVEDSEKTVNSDTPPSAKPQKRRGRPPKKKVDEESAS